MIYAVVLSIIVVVLLGTALVRSLGVKNQADFLVAGRKLAWPVLVFTLLSSWIGAGSLFAGAENAYRNGFSALWQPAGGWVGLVLIAMIAGRARRFAQFTVPDLLETRYNTAARVLATVAIVISYTIITSYQFKGGGYILHFVFPSLDQRTGMNIIAVFVITFTALAGMASVAYLDLIIGLLVTVIALISLPLLLAHTGGWPALHEKLPADRFTMFGRLGWVHCLAYLLPTMLLLIGNQGMYQKFFSARSERDARWAVFGWIAGTLVLETVIITIAVIGSSVLKTNRPHAIAAVSRRHPAGRRLRQSHFDSQQLSLLARQQPDPRRLQALHRSASGRAPHPDRLAPGGRRPGRFRPAAGRLLRVGSEGRPLCLHRLRRGRHTICNGGILLEAGQQSGCHQFHRFGNGHHGGLADSGYTTNRRGLSGAGHFRAGADRGQPGDGAALARQSGAF